MANWKRKRCRRVVRCTICTDVRWLGNRKGRFKAQDEASKKEFKKRGR